MPRNPGHADIIAAAILILLLGRPFGNLIPKLQQDSGQIHFERSLFHAAPHWALYRP